jgi:hypothetical protein
MCTLEQFKLSSRLEKKNKITLKNLLKKIK